MKWTEFEGELNRLKSVFSDRSYPNERVKILWYQVKDANVDAFAKAVDRWIGELKFAPIIPEFREFYNEWLKQVAADRILNKRGINSDRECGYCGDEGQVLAYHRETQEFWSFLCSFCDAPKRRNMITFKDETGRIVSRTFWQSEFTNQYDLRELRGRDAR